MRRLVAVTLVLLAACSDSPDAAEEPFRSQKTRETAGQNRDFVTRTEKVIAVGDIASCASTGDEATAALVDGLEGTIITLGDNVYERGTKAEWQRCFEPSWGRHKSRMKPSPGNHDYAAAAGAAYHEYFGVPRYYAFDLGSWRLISLNSNCDVVSCAPGSEQFTWLRDELAAHPAKCTLAYYHHPRFSSGLHGSTEAMADLYGLLTAHGVDVLLAGHDHHYERLVDGPVRHFTVGTGGASLYPVLAPERGSEIHDTATYGVLTMTLSGGRYEWKFVPVPGATFTDQGSANCH